jgi:YHS domain-containing protein
MPPATESEPSPEANPSPPLSDTSHRDPPTRIRITAESHNVPVQIRVGAIHIPDPSPAERPKPALAESAGEERSSSIGEVQDLPDATRLDPPASQRLAGITFGRYQEPTAFAPAVAALQQRLSQQERRTEKPQAQPQSPLEHALAEAVVSEEPVELWSEPPGHQVSASKVELVQHVEPPQPQNLAPQLAGYCPVALVENEKWVAGELSWAVLHRGHVYHMSGPAQQQRFLDDPDRYTPILSGLDPVLLFDETQEVPGRTDHCVVYDGRVFVFASRTSVARFRQNPRRYAEAARQLGGS